MHIFIVNVITRCLPKIDQDEQYKNKSSAPKVLEPHAWNLGQCGEFMDASVVLIMHVVLVMNQMSMMFKVEVASFFEFQPWQLH